MAVVENEQIAAYCLDVAQRAKAASSALALLSGQQKNDWLNQSADALQDGLEAIQRANEQDLAAAPGYGLSDAQIDRLRLTDARVAGVAQALREIAMLPDPVGSVLESNVRPNGLEVARVRVPLGVVFFVYESRPNVTADAAAICVKSGNAVILRGGKEAIQSSQAIAAILQRSAEDQGIPADAVQLVNTTDRAAVGQFLGLADYIDVTIPRGGEGLIRRVAAEATMPVIKHFTGNCHLYVDPFADLEMARSIAVNAKCQRMGVCNTLESLLVHSDIATEFLPQLATDMAEHAIEFRGDERTCELIPAAKPATDEDYYREYLAPIISVKIVSSLNEAIGHINKYGSHHTDAIVTSNLEVARRFTQAVDSAAVMVNASTRFNDGGEFGLGAEIGISTDKFHARGPCGLNELTSYKFVVYGNGQIRT